MKKTPQEGQQRYAQNRPDSSSARQGTENDRSIFAADKAELMLSLHAQDVKHGIFIRTFPYIGNRH